MVQKRVGDIMGGRVLELDIIKAHREGKSEGRTEGRNEGRNEERANNIRKLAENYMSKDASLTKEEAYEMARSVLE
ncbi:MAG: hypothetical protein IJ232_04635 [Lachnospiraceae bacterium]|nr:hypothetical protein [Lachnospiraceae bacterium]